MTRLTTLAIAFFATAVMPAQPQPRQPGGSARDSKFPTIADDFRPATFAARRAKLSAVAGDGLVVLFRGKNPIDACEEHANDPFFRVGPFRQEENFFYLTGLSVPDLAVVIDPASK